MIKSSDYRGQNYYVEFKDVIMARKIKIYQVDAFTSEIFRGNPAGVVPNAESLSDTEMQAIAREMNNSETAFIMPAPTDAGYDVEVRFFTPTTEVPICGHATISAHYVRAVEKQLPSTRVVQKTKAGILPVDIVNEGKDYSIVMTQGVIEFGNTIDGEIKRTLLSALGLLDSDMDRRCPIQIVSTGHSKVMIGINNRSKLNTLSPDMQQLKMLSDKISCNGYFVFTFDSPNKEILTHGRMFAPAIGINEDPVTGNANGPLGAYIVRHKLADFSGNQFRFKAQQGEAIGRTGQMEVIVEISNQEPARVKVCGNAKIVYKVEVELESRDNHDLKW